MASPARLPFASLSGARLKNMINIKNKQNALATTPTSALKRHAPAEFDDVDSENIDPLIFSSPSKKGRTFDFDISKSNETPLFASPPARPAQYIERAQAAGQKRKAEDTVTPAAGIKRRVEPSSAPALAPAGRSPKHKRIGILSRRRMTTSPITRVNPPSSAESTDGMPFSIDAALAGTVPKFKSKSTHGKHWQFEIHEDTADDELDIAIQHRTHTLDISGDESSPTKGDKDNKENIPPIDGPAAIPSATQVTAARRDMMTEEVRAPLGDLDAEAFYADGCDASSYIIVPPEDSSEQIMDKLSTTTDSQEPSLPTCSPANTGPEVRAGWEDVVARFAAKTTHTTIADADADFGTEKGTSKEATEIQIWESESAKGDDDADAQGIESDGVNHESVLA